MLAAASHLLAEKCGQDRGEQEQNERYAELTSGRGRAQPYIGYDKVGEIVEEAAASGRSLRRSRDAGVEESVLDEALDYRKMAKPHGG